MEYNDDRPYLQIDLFEVKQQWEWFQEQEKKKKEEQKSETVIIIDY